jgi:hypothetical protein
MSANDEQVVEDGVFEEVAPPSVALVPLVPPMYLTRKSASPRPDPSFVTQLIATAEQLPQTRILRRAAPADAMSAYRAGARSVVGTLPRTRQII